MTYILVLWMIGIHGDITLTSIPESFTAKQSCEQAGAQFDGVDQFANRRCHFCIERVDPK